MSDSPYIIPMVGTSAHEEFVRRAKNPNSVEGQMAAQMAVQASNAASDRLRSMLHQMIQLVPGQMFRDVVAFHEKFGLKPTDDPNHELTEDMFKFRAKFLFEELIEYCDACGYSVSQDMDVGFSFVKGEGRFDPELALDAIVDLCYVALGTAYLHRFLEFNEAWRRVQECNLAKVRAVSSDDPLSKRKHSVDVVKPEGWKPPSHTDLLDEPCAVCQGEGVDGTGCTDACPTCNGKKYVRRDSLESEE